MSNSVSKGLPASAFQVRELKLSAKKEEPKETSGSMSALDQLEMCRRKVNNYRQGDAIDRIISLCEEEPLPVKMNKVIVNINAMLAFARLSDANLSMFMSRSIRDIYDDAFTYFGLPTEEKDRLFETRKVTHQTTVEVNHFINGVINDSIARINNLPATIALRSSMVDQNLMRDDAPLYNATDIRERALFYFAAISGQEKTCLINEIAAEYGMLLTRLTDKQFEKKRATLRF